MTDKIITVKQAEKMALDILYKHKKERNKYLKEKAKRFEE